jgi:MOSC domain-containing protein YiiM
MPSASLLSVHVGRIAPLGPEGVPSGFVKHAAPGAVHVAPLGLEGDEQADLTVHGGPDKAVYGYGAAHYAAWAAEYPEHGAKFTGGGMGENLSIAELDETGICVGDIHAIGGAVLQVCQPRQPCFKFALRFDDNRLPRAMVRNGRAGWYYRVLESGTIKAGDAVTLQERPNPDFAFARLVEIVNFNNATRPELERLAQLPGIARRLQARARQALRGTVPTDPEW